MTLELIKIAEWVKENPQMMCADDEWGVYRMLSGDYELRLVEVFDDRILSIRRDDDFIEAAVYFTDTYVSAWDGEKFLSIFKRHFG